MPRADYLVILKFPFRKWAIAMRAEFLESIHFTKNSARIAMAPFLKGKFKKWAIAIRAEFLESIHFTSLLGNGNDVTIAVYSQRFAIVQLILITDWRPAIVSYKDRHIDCLPRC